MEIEPLKITLRDLIEGYEDKGLGGVVAYGGKLEVRPPYQREYIYGEKARDAVIRSVKQRFPVNVMYWSKVGDRYELMDGQQRTISVCRYAAENQQTFSVDYQYFFNLEEDEKERILGYPLDIYVCDGTPSEVLSWFKVINIAGLKLSDQELRNVSYTGPWLADAKIHFSKPTCAAYNMAKDYMKTGLSPLRQQYLEVAISWIADRDGLYAIEDYMAKHQPDENASQLWLYFQKVIQWVEAVFPRKRSEMKGVAWGLLYNAYKDAELDPNNLEAEVSRLMEDEEVQKKSGIYYYVLDGKERHLNLRAFSSNQKREAYERQKGICPGCGVPFTIEQMEAHHITPWADDGKTVSENCQMLCKEDHRRTFGG